MKTLKQWAEAYHHIDSPIESGREFVDGKLKEFKQYSFVPSESLGQTFVGIEIEVERVPTLCLDRPRPTFAMWMVKKDGTLRNHGMELVTKPLSSAQAVGAALAELRYHLDHELADHDFSWRTSTHVHMSALHYILQDIANFLLVYPVVEPVLFEAFAPGRKHSVFCVPFISTKMRWDMIKKILREVDSVKADKFDWLKTIVNSWKHDHNKYGAVNFSRMYDIGTIEFRHLPGTDDFALISSWIACLTRLVTFCCQQSHSTVKKSLLALADAEKRKPFLKLLFGAKEFERLAPFTDYLEDGLKKTIMLIHTTSKSGILKVSNQGAFSQKVERVRAKKLERAKRRYVSL